MNRREEREHKFRLLFCTLFYPQDEVEGQLERYFLSTGYEEEEEAVQKTLPTEQEETRLKQQVEAIVEKIPELDAGIDKVVEGWKTGRMGKVELTLLRLALFEIRYSEDVPAKVAINEAVELAKKYGGPDSKAFVNGVLAKLID